MVARLQFSPLTQLCPTVTPWTAARQTSLSITNSRSWLKLISIESVMPSNHLILCCPLLLPRSTFPSIRVFSDESALHIRWPEYWSISFSLSPSMNIQDWSLRWTGWIASQLKGLSRGFSNTTVQKHQIKVTFFVIMKYMFRFFDYSFIPGRKRGMCLQRWRLWWRTVAGKESGAFTWVSRLLGKLSPLGASVLLVWDGGRRENMVSNEAKSKGDKERHTYLNAEFQRIARRDKKALLSNQCKEIEENNRIGKTRDVVKKIRKTKETFHAKMGTIKDRNRRY